MILSRLERRWSDFLSSVLRKRTSSCRRAEIYPLYRHHTHFLRIKCFLRIQTVRRAVILAISTVRQRAKNITIVEQAPSFRFVLSYVRSKAIWDRAGQETGKEHHGRWSWNVLARSLTFLSTPLSLYSLKSSFVPWKMVFCSLTAVPVIEKRFLLRYAPLTFRRKVGKKKKKETKLKAEVLETVARVQYVWC